MKDQDKTIEKLLTIEKAVNEMVELRQQIIELKESETKRLIANEALQESEKKYRTLVENIPQKLFIKDKNSVYVSCNESYAKDLKIKPEEIAGKTDYDFFPKDLAEKYTGDDRRIMEEGRLENIEEKYVHEGQSFLIQTVKTPIRDEKGESVGILGIFWDITEQKRNEEELRKYRIHLEDLVTNRTNELQTAHQLLQQEMFDRRQVEEKLRQTEEEYRAILENTGTAAAVINEEGLTISLANREFEKISGYAKEDLEGKKKWADFVSREDFEKMREYQLARQANPESIPRNYECRFIDKQGEVREILMTTALIPGVKKSVVSLWDISNRKRNEEELQILAEKYRALVEKANEAVIVIQDGLVKFFNPKIFEITGYKNEELALRPFEEFIYPGDREDVELHFNMLKDGRPSHFYSFRIMHKDGHIRWLGSKVALIQWEGKPALINYLADITDRKQAEEELRNSIEPFRALVQAMEKILSTLHQG